MGVEKRGARAVEDVAALHSFTGSVATGSETVELRLSVSATFFHKCKTWSLSSELHPNACSIDCHVHDSSAFFCKSRAALTESLRVCACAEMPSSTTCVIASCQRYPDRIVSNHKGSQSHSDHCAVHGSKARTI